MLCRLDAESATAQYCLLKVAENGHIMLKRKKNYFTGQLKRFQNILFFPPHFPIFFSSHEWKTSLSFSRFFRTRVVDEPHFHVSLLPKGVREYRQGGGGLVGEKSDSQSNSRAPETPVRLKPT